MPAASATRAISPPRVDLADKVSLSKPADRRIARHDADAVDLLRHQRRARAHTRGGGRCFAAGMSAADHHHVETIVLKHDANLRGVKRVSRETGSAVLTPTRCARHGFTCRCRNLRTTDQARSQGRRRGHATQRAGRHSQILRRQLRQACRLRRLEMGDGVAQGCDGALARHQRRLGSELLGQKRGDPLAQGFDALSGPDANRAVGPLCPGPRSAFVVTRRHSCPSLTWTEAGSVSGDSTRRTRSAPAPRNRARRTPSFSISSSLWRRPAVSTKVTGQSPMLAAPSTASRVVPAMLETMAMSRPHSAFISDDLPALGGQG